MEHINYFRLFEDVEFEMDTIEDKIEEICDEHNLYYYGDEPINKQKILSCMKIYDGLMTTWVEPGEYYESEDGFRIQIFIKDKVWSKKKEELSELIDWLVDAEEYPLLRYNDEIKLKNFKFLEKRNLGSLSNRKIDMTYTEISDIVRIIDLCFECEVIR